MSEILKNLIEVHTDTWQDMEGDWYSEVNAPRLAAAIVQACATYLNVAAEVHSQAEQDVCDRAAIHLKEHFGVK